MSSETENSKSPKKAPNIPEFKEPLRAEGLEVLNNELPWKDPQIMPQKPDGYLYGVRFKDDPKHGDGHRPCGTEQELITLMFGGNSKIEYVYLPDEDFGVPIHSLNCFQPLRKKDFGKHVLRFLQGPGLFGIGALVAAFVFPKHQFAFSLFFVGLMFGVFPLMDVLLQWIMYPGKKSAAELKQTMVHNASFNSWVGKNPVSKLPIFAMVGIFVAVFLAQALGPEGYLDKGRLSTISQVGAIRASDVREGGEWWRLFTGTLMHANLFLVGHIGMNSVAFIYLSKFVMRLTNVLVIPTVFVVSAFTGALASTLFSDHPLGALGASGGVVGLLGFLAFMVFARPNQLPYQFRNLTVRNILMLIILGVILPFVDNSGHAGGFVGGLICAGVYEVFHRNKWAVPNSPAKIGLAVVSFLIMIFGLATCMDLLLGKGKYIVEHLPRIPW